MSMDVAFIALSTAVTSLQLREEQISATIAAIPAGLASLAGIGQLQSESALFLLHVKSGWHHVKVIRLADGRRALRA